MAEWVAVCRFDNLISGRGRRYQVRGLDLALVRDGEAIVVLLDRCPHEGGSLGQGWVEDGAIVCPLHRWRFKLSDGRCSTVRGESVHRFQAEVREGMVWVRV